MSARRFSGVMFDETADGLSPAPDVADIVANRFGSKMSGEGIPIGGGRRLVRQHGCNLYQRIPKDGLDVVG